MKSLKREASVLIFRRCHYGLRLKKIVPHLKTLICHACHPAAARRFIFHLIGEYLVKAMAMDDVRLNTRIAERVHSIVFDMNERYVPTIQREQK